MIFLSDENNCEIFSCLLNIIFKLGLLINQIYFCIVEIIITILAALVAFSCLSVWFNASELDTDDEDF